MNTGSKPLAAFRDTLPGDATAKVRLVRSVLWQGFSPYPTASFWRVGITLRLLVFVLVSITPALGADNVIFTGTATVEQSCDSTFQVTSGFTLTVNLDNSILPLDASEDSGFGQYDGLVQSWSFSWDDPALSFGPALSPGSAK